MAVLAVLGDLSSYTAAQLAYGGSSAAMGDLSSCTAAQLAHGCFWAAMDNLSGSPAAQLAHGGLLAAAGAAAAAGASNDSSTTCASGAAGAAAAMAPVAAADKGKAKTLPFPEEAPFVCGRLHVLRAIVPGSNEFSYYSLGKIRLYWCCFFHAQLDMNP